MGATPGGPVSDIEQLIESPDLLGLGAAADERRRAIHGDRVTFVRVQPVAMAVTELEALPGAGELRIVGEPETGQEAIGATQRLVARAGSIPVTGFVLDDLDTLCRHDVGTLQGLLRDLRAAGLAMVSALGAENPRARECLDASREAGIDVARLIVATSAADGGVSLFRQVAAWGAATAHVHSFAPLVQATDERATTGYGDVRRVALARLLVDNIGSIQVDWSRYGPKLAQVALTCGADDVDAVSPVDSVEDGPRRAPLEEINRNIRAAALVPVQRNGRFETCDV